MTDQRFFDNQITQLGQAFESLDDAVVIVDAGDKLVFANSACEILYGYPKEELLGKSISIIVPHGQFAVTPEMVNSAPAERWTGEITMFRRGGEEFAAHLAVTLLRDESGEVIGRILAVRDLTQLKQAEEAAAHLATERNILANIGRVISSSTDITERKHSEDQILESQHLQAVGLLARGVAHDFNNMLSAIMSYAYMTSILIPQGDKKVGYLQQIQRAAERASELTRQLLAFSRRRVIEPRIIDLSTVVIDAVKMIRPLIGEDIELIAIPNENLWTVEADPSQIELVLVNLTFNARDAMPEGGKLTIETANITLNADYTRLHPEAIVGDHVLLVLADTGTGMSEEVDSHVFDSFYTTKGFVKGVGLGFSICHSIITQSGGHITLDSAPGQGTTAKIYLPRIEGSVEVVHPGDYEDVLPVGDETILLVEDEQIVRNALADILRQQGYVVLDASNGEDALRVAIEHEGEDIHLLLTDVVMPLIGGWELTSRFKELHREACVICMSGYTVDMTLHEDVLGDGAIFLPKPILPRELLHKVRAVLDAQKENRG